MKVAEAAKKADVSPSTITRWVQAGTLSARRLASGVGLERYAPRAAPRASDSG